MDASSEVGRGNVSSLTRWSYGRDTLYLILEHIPLLRGEAVISDVQ